MKANEAPEKIYIFEEDLQHEDHIVMYGINQDKDIRGLVEYTRTDAFIEKVCNLLARMIWEVTYEDLEGNSTQHYDKMEFIEDVRNHMKGE